jgi:hypothetical protein
MSNAFKEIKLKLEKKEKEIMEKTDIFLQEHIQELNTYSRILQSKIISMNKIMDSINSNIIRKDEVNLLNFFSESSNKILHSVEAEIPEIPDLNNIYNMKIAINQSSFENMINNLNGLFLEITSMKGYEINKLNNSYKYSIRRDMYGTTPTLHTNGSAFNSNNNNNSQRNIEINTRKNMKIINNDNKNELINDYDKGFDVNFLYFSLIFFFIFFIFFIFLE